MIVFPKWSHTQTVMTWLINRRKIEWLTRLSLSLYSLAMIDLTFILTWTFWWKVLVITMISSFPLYVVKKLRRVFAPPSYSKLTG